MLILHGLEGSLESHYTGGMLDALARENYTAALMYFRGRSGEPNRLPRGYHSGETSDIDFVVRHIKNRHPEKSIAVIGYSLGGNVLLKWLGEQADTAPVTTAIAISVPFDLNSAALQLEKGLSRIYQGHLLKKLRESITAKSDAHTLPFPLHRLHELQTFRQFDNEITAPLHGFQDVDDYYTRSSSKQFLKYIHIPTLVIQAKDDPFLPASALPDDTDLSPSVTLELAQHGGHVGFVSGNNPLHPEHWLEQRALTHLGTFS